MKKMKTIIGVLMLLMPSCAFSQDIQVHSKDIMNMPFTCGEKDVLDTALLKIYYELDFKKDSTSDERIQAQTILLAGDRYLMFDDYFHVKLDSLSFIWEKEKRKSGEVMPQLFQLMSMQKYQIKLICDILESKINVCESVVGDYYQYEEPTPEINWTILEGDSIINDYPCGKAACRYRGRDYIAWYAKDISIPLGPYLFHGLPGLIFMIKDTKDNFRFTLNGLENQTNDNDLIYLEISNLTIKNSREKVRATIKKNFDNPLEVLLQDPRIRISKETLAKKPNRKPRPYNPMELE